MAKKIAIFNHKGGVSKTTTAFNIGWRLARAGKKVLLVDADSQCNLSQYAMGAEAFDKFYQSLNPNNIKDALVPAFTSKPKLIEAPDCIKLKSSNNLFLLPGHLDLSENEVQLGLSFQLTESVGALKNLPGSFNYLFSKLSDKYNIDYIIIDMNPSLSAINQDLLLSSDYFMVPTSPDIFSYMSIKSLAKVLPNWERWAKKARPMFRDAEYPLPENTPKFLGYTVNDFNLADGGRPAHAFRNLMDSIADIVQRELVPNLDSVDMLLHMDYYDAAHALNGRMKNMRPLNKYCIAEISNFNRLIAISNKTSTPIFELGHLNIRMLKGQEGTLRWFCVLYELIVDKILSLTK